MKVSSQPDERRVLLYDTHTHTHIHTHTHTHTHKTLINVYIQGGTSTKGTQELKLTRTKHNASPLWDTSHTNINHSFITSV